MSNIPHILFDSNTEILYSTVPNAGDIRDLFLKSLRRGDRTYFNEFCAVPFNPDAPQFWLFQLDKFPYAEYAFAEKDTLNSCEVNVVYLASEFSDFYPLMSPSSHYFRSITGKCIHDILHAGSNRGLNVTPDAYLAIDAVPHLRDELLSEPKSMEYCSVLKTAEQIVKALADIPSFSHLELLLPEDRDDPTFILAIPLCSYVFLLTALIWIMHTVSDDHRIQTEIRAEEERVRVVFRVSIPKSKITDIDSGSLLSLSKLSPSTGSLSAIAASVAFTSKIATTVTSQGSVLETDVSIARDNDETLGFHYREPYHTIPGIVEEFIRFFGLLDLSSGNEA